MPDRLVDADENDSCMKLLVLERSLGGPWGCPWGGLWGSWGEPGEEEKRRRFSGASWDGPGSPLGWFWRYGAILGSVLGGQTVVIS